MIEAERLWRTTQGMLRITVGQVKSAELPEEVRKEADREMTRLDRLSAQAPDYNVGRTWLEFVLDLPWARPALVTASLDDLGGCTFRSDLAAMRHETQYTRLFRS